MEPPVTILLVDDEERLRLTLGKMLRAQGFVVREADSGTAAVAALTQEPAEIVILDLKMPGMSGAETLKALKDRDPDLEVIILTGHASLDDAAAIMQLGGTEYLLKPCPFDELLTKIEAAVERRRTRRRRSPKN